MALVEFGAFLLGELFFHFGNRIGELGPIDVLHRGGDVGEHGEALLRHFGQATEHDDLVVRAAGGDRQDPRTDCSYHRRMASEHAEITLDAGDVDLIDLACEGKLFGGDEIEVEGGHVEPCE